MTTNVFSISAAGMDIERLRVDVAAANLANASAAIGADGGYQPMQVVSRAGGLRGATPSFGDWMQAPTVSVVPTGAVPLERQEPWHPLADAKGIVRYPAVDHTTEMVNMMQAMRAYEANVAAMNTSRTMLLKAIEIGGAQ